MLLAWVATVVLIALIIWRIRRILRWRAPVSQAEAFAYGCLVVGASVGSVVLYLGSMPWVYHEAYAWAIATGLAAGFCLLGAIERPSRRRIIACGIAVLAAVLCRTTTGWAFGAAVAGTAVWWFTGHRGEQAKGRARLLLAAALLPLVVGGAVNFAKFSHPYLFPLQDQEWTGLNAHRREALAANGGDLVSPKLLPSTVTAYFRPDGIRFIGTPPFITFPNDPPRSLAGGFLDQTYRTGSAVAFMPLLMGLAVWGLVTAFRPRGPTHASYLRLPLLGAGAIAGPILIYGYISYRYEAELMPLFVLAGAVGLVDLAQLVSLQSSTLRRWFTGGLAALACYGVVANAAVALTTESLANPGRPLAHYLAMQEGISALLPGDPISDLVARSTHLPAEAPGEHLQIVGDCRGLYVSQAETFWPWVPAEIRGLEFRIQIHPPAVSAPVSIELAHVLDRGGALSYERRPSGLFRLVYRSDTTQVVGHWGSTADRTIAVSVRPSLADETYDVVANDGYHLPVPLAEFDEVSFRFQNLLVATEDPVPAGVTVRELSTPRPALCDRLINRVPLESR
jgi:hypothetical protein